MRLLTGCERIRKLLSQLNESQITVENLTDSGDVSFTLKREEFATLSAELIERFKALIDSVLTTAGVEKSTVVAVEVLGGGVRMPIVQQVITGYFGDSIPLGAKFDDASIALGAALLFNAASVSVATSSAGSNR
jgi:heat shock protein 4